MPKAMNGKNNAYWVKIYQLMYAHTIIMSSNTLSSYQIHKNGIHLRDISVLGIMSESVLSGSPTEERTSLQRLKCRESQRDDVITGLYT